MKCADATTYAPPSERRSYEQGPSSAFRNCMWAARAVVDRRPQVWDKGNGLGPTYSQWGVAANRTGASPKPAVVPGTLSVTSFGTIDFPGTSDSAAYSLNDHRQFVADLAPIACPRRQTEQSKDNRKDRGENEQENAACLGLISWVFDLRKRST